VCRSQWPRGLRRRSKAVRLLGLWVRIPPRAWMCVSCGVVFCNLEVVHRADRSSRGALVCVCVCVWERERERECVLSWSFKNEEALVHYGAVTPWGWELCSVYRETGNLVPWIKRQECDAKQSSLCSARFTMPPFPHTLVGAVLKYCIAQAPQLPDFINKKLNSHKIGRGFNLSAHLHLVSRLRISRNTLQPFMSRTKTKLPTF